MVLVPETELFAESEWVEIVEGLSLSPRQAEIIYCLLHGYSDKQIATKLKICLPTVRTHLSRLFSKYQVQDRMELVLYVVRHFCKHSKTNGFHHI